MDMRLQSRSTYLHYNEVLMGPIHDKRGVKQGGSKSGKQFQLTTNNELKAINTGSGADVAGVNIGASAYADDTFMISHTIGGFQKLLNISEEEFACNYMNNVALKTY